MDSSPESGPIMTSAPSCSMSRRVSLMAVSARSSEQPTPTILIGWSPMAPPVMPSRGLFGFLGFAPANCEKAATTPARSWLSNEPNAPWQSDRTPILIGVLLPPVCAATAGWGAGQSICACSVLVLLELELESELDLSLELSLEPHPATTAAASTVAVTAQVRPPRNLMRFGMLSPLLPSGRPDVLELVPTGAAERSSGDRGQACGRPLLVGLVVGARPALEGPDRALPDAEQAIGGHQDDHQEHDTDQRVEPVADEPDVLRVVVQEHEDEGAQPGALEAVEAADDGDDEHVDRRAEADGRRRDLTVPPDEEDPADPGRQPGERERQHAVQRHAVAERAHAHRVVADALHRQPERRPGGVTQPGVAAERDEHRDEVQPLRVAVRVDPVRHRDAADAAEPGQVGHLPEEQVGDHAEDERDHQEVDAVAAAGDRAEQQRDEERDGERDDHAGQLGPAEVEALCVAVRRQVAEREAGDPVDRHLGKRHHAA